MKTFKELLSRLLLKKGSTPLPMEYVLIAFIAEIVMGITRTSVFAYLPRLVQEFGISEKNTGTYVGYVASCITISASFFSFLIGYLTDRFNKKYVIVCGCAYGSLTALLLGSSTNIRMLLVIRCLQGAPCILIPALAILFEKCDSTNKPAAMTIATLGFDIGQVMGPIVGGYLSFPDDNISSSLKGTIFDWYPILLPNVVISISLASLTTAIVFVDYTPSNHYSQIKDSDCDQKKDVEETKQLEIDNQDKKETCDVAVQRDDRPRIIQVLSNKNAMLICISFSLFGLFYFGFNEMFPVWASTTSKYNGLQFSTKDIGQSVFFTSVPMIIIQFAVLSKLTQLFGVKKLYIAAVLAQACFYLLFPELVLIKQQKILLWFALCMMMLIIRICAGQCFLSITVLLNTTVGNELLGTINGLGWVSYNLASAAAPTMFGMIYSWSLNNVKGVSSNKHPLGFPFDQYFVFSIMSICCLVSAVIMSFVKDSSKSTKEMKKESSQ